MENKKSTKYVVIMSTQSLLIQIANITSIRVGRYINGVTDEFGYGDQRGEIIHGSTFILTRKRKLILIHLECVFVNKQYPTS